MKRGRRSTGRAHSAFDIPILQSPNKRVSSANQHNFARLLSEMHQEIQEKEIALQEAWQLNYELGEKVDKIETECMILNSQLNKSQSELKSARKENELLRITISDLQGRVNDLQNVNYERSENLDRMAMNLQFFENETEVYKLNQ